MATIYRTDGTQEEVQPDSRMGFTLQYLQKVVGGYIEIVRVGNDRLMVLNEEGKLNSLPYNHMATVLFQNSHGPIDIIVGDVIVGTPRELGEEEDEEDE